MRKNVLPHDAVSPMSTSVARREIRLLGVVLLVSPVLR